AAPRLRREGRCHWCAEAHAFASWSTWQGAAQALPKRDAATGDHCRGWSRMRRLWQGSTNRDARKPTGVIDMGVVVAFEDKEAGQARIEKLVDLVRADMERVNAMILSRTGSDVTMIPEVANHLISSGGKRLRPMLTLATAGLCGYQGEGHVKLAASVEFMHTATLLHDDVVDESDMRRGKLAARMLWGNEASVLEIGRAS